MTMRGLLFFMRSEKVDHQYRNQNEAKLAKTLNEARATLANLVDTYIGGLYECRRPEDVWIDVDPDVENGKRLGLVSKHGEGHQLIIRDGEDDHGLHELDHHELTELFERLPELKREVIKASIDHLGEIQSAIAFFRENVLGVASDEEE